MVHFIHYTAWFNIFAMALNLSVDQQFHDELIIKTRWGYPEEIRMSAGEDSGCLFIEICDNKNKATLISFVLLPWQEMHEIRPSEAMVPEISAARPYTVTPFAIIYTIDHVTDDDGIYEQMDQVAERIFNYEDTQMVFFAQDGFTSEEGTQVMSLTEYPWYVDVQAALPGSIHPDGSEFAKEFPRKMIRMCVLPEKGEGWTHWIKPEEGPFEQSLLDLEENLAGLYAGALESCLADRSMENRQNVYEKAKGDLYRLLDSSGLACDSIPEFCSDLLERLLAFDPQTETLYDPDELFADYVPKMTSDELLDFRPALTSRVNALPEPQLEELPLLISRYRESRKEARKNPGEWVEGNLLLGARPQEYRPSDEELLLNEIGERIRHVVKEESGETIRSVLEKSGIKKRKIKYPVYSFIHMDVMGSGRFFYVDDIEEIKLRLY